MTPQDFGIGQAELSPFDKSPNRISGIANSGSSAADAFGTLDR
jgi:hypothetical protein